MLKILGDEKLPAEDIGGVGDVVRFGERRVTMRITKAFFPSSGTSPEPKNRNHFFN